MARFSAGARASQQRHIDAMLKHYAQKDLYLGLSQTEEPVICYFLLHRDRIELKSPYDVDLVSHIMKLPASKRRWDQTERLWVFPVDKDTYSHLSRYFMYGNGKKRGIRVEVISFAEGINKVSDYWPNSVNTETHYTALNLKEDATQADIKTAYRVRVRKLHPDKGGDDAGFIAVNTAYEVLSDPIKKKRYDAALTIIRSFAK